MIAQQTKGIYAVYFTAIGGNSMGLFFIGDGIIAGSDVGGVRYDGQYTVRKQDGSLEGVLEFEVPPHGQLITGLSNGPEPIKVPVQLHLPADFASGQVITISTPAGVVNARFEKLRELP